MGNLKIFKSILFTLILAITLVSASSLNVFATSGSKTFTSSGKMNVVLRTNQKGDSNEIDVLVSGLPKKAVITKIQINTGSLSFTGGVVTNYLTVRSSNGRTEQIPWNGQANKILDTNNFLESNANGTYKLSFNATCISGAIVNGRLTEMGTKSYSRPSVTIYWDDEFHN